MEVGKGRESQRTVNHARFVGIAAVTAVWTDLPRGVEGQ